MREHSVSADIEKRVGVCVCVCVCVKYTADSRNNKNSNDQMLCILRYSCVLENKKIRGEGKV